MAFLRGVKWCSKLDLIKNEARREELQVINLYERLKDYKQRWKEHFERVSDSRLTKQVWKHNPIGHRCVGSARKRWLEDLRRRNRQHVAYAVLLSLIHI